MFTKRFGVATTAATLLMMMLSRGISEGALIDYFVEFEATEFHGVLGTTPPVDVVSGSFSFTLDDLAIPPQIFPPNTVNLSIGDVTYDVTNTAVYTFMTPLVFGYAFVGTVNGSFAAGNTDDFLFVVSPPGNSYAYTVRNSGDSYFSSTVSQQISVMTPVPEPGSLMLFALGGYTWLVANVSRRRGSRTSSTQAEGLTIPNRRAILRPRRRASS